MAEKLNVLLIVAPALRVDRFACYGGSGSATSAIDALALSGCVAESFHGSATPIEAGWGAFVTGMHPVNLGMASTGGGAQLLPGVTVLAEFFLSAGYTTCAFDNLRRAVHWFGNGAEYYIDAGVRHDRAATPAETNSRVVPWLRSHRREPIFATIRYSHPFRAGEPTTAAMYDSYVSEVNASTGELLSALDRLQLSRSTLVAFAGAAGWSLGEHGVWGEAGLHECTNHVPLLLRCPGTIPPGTRFPGEIQTQDLAPTLMDAAGLRPPSNLDGSSFWKALCGEGSWHARESLYAVDCAADPQRWSLRKAGLKLIAALSPEGEVVERSLYRLADDPGEERNLIESDSVAADSMTADLLAWRTQRLDEWAAMELLMREE